MSRWIKTEHAGAKNGGGYWGRRAEAKRRCRSLRRQRDANAVRNELAASWVEAHLREVCRGQ